MFLLYLLLSIFFFFFLFSFFLFFFSLYFTVCFLSIIIIIIIFCVSPLFFFSFFWSLCVPLSIYREIPKKPFLILLSTDQIMEQFSSVFSSTTPNFMLSRDPLFSFFLFSLFRCVFKLLFSLWQPTFTKPCSLLSGGNTSLSLFLFYLYIYIFLFRDNGRLTFC